MKSVKLNNGIEMPIIGYGVFMIEPSITERCVLDALSVGYRSLDTAQYYENEAAVGAAVRKSGIPRDQFFITSKLCQSRPSYVQAKAIGDVGIPCYVLEDGTVTLYSKDVGLESRPENYGGAACRIDGKGC